MRKKSKKNINIKKITNDIYDFLKKNINIIVMVMPFYLLDLLTRIFGSDIEFFKAYRLVPNLFTVLWIYLFVGFVILSKKTVSKILYIFFALISVAFYLVNNVYYSMTSNFFDFNLLESTGEGAPYMLDALFNCNIWVYILLVPVIVLFVLGFKWMPKNNKFDGNRMLRLILVFVIAHTITPLFLGKANSDLIWSTWKNPRNIYNAFNDNNKSMRVAGLYEYTVRNFYITYLKTEEVSQDDLAFLEGVYSEEKKLVNSYTGKFANKNLIFVQLEGLDSWMLTKKDTPTLYSMLNNSINFTNHYSFYNGGGSTFNSEFAVNAGFIVPFSYNKNAYSFNKNAFPYSMANLFKLNDYSVNAFHMNSGEYYSRSINYKNWGYDNYYGLIDIFKYDDNQYMLDREMLNNTEFSDLMFPTDKRFVDYLITYSAHLPFNSSKGVCKMLVDEDALSNPQDEVNILSEEECARRQIKETDYMMELLLSKLKEKGLLKNTIIVAYADHYLYTLEDQTILDKYKNTSNNLINKTPFFIWSYGMKKSTVSKVNSQLDILPTVLNLFGVSYNANNYIGVDILDKCHPGLVYFSDYSWYDGTLYVENGEVTNGKRIKNRDKFDSNNLYVSYITKKNDLTLKYNYFKYTN